MGNKAVKTPLGMVSSYFFPFASEPVGTHPVYGDKVDMGAAVKGYLSLATASGDITGDDAMLLYFEQFVSGQIDVETTLSDLEVNAKIYGHSYKAGRETAKGEDSAPNGAYAFIEPILKKDKTLVYRASFFYKTTAMLSAEKQEADTRKSDFNPKMNAVNLRVMKDNAGIHRLQRGLPGYLILFAPHAFAPQRQLSSSRPPSPLVFLLISTHFTATLGIPPASPVL